MSSEWRTVFQVVRDPFLETLRLPPELVDLYTDWPVLCWGLGARNTS